MAQATRDLDLGTGVYSLAEATRIVGRSVGRASPRQVRHWVDEGLSESIVREGTTLLSFQDLVSLEMVSRFRRRGVSLYAVKVADMELRRRHPNMRRPFANLIFYTDGKNIWTLTGDEGDRLVLELTKKVDQVAWLGAIETFAAEIRFVNGTAASWHPTEWVELNPHIQFGEPVVAGTRIPVRTIAANLTVGTAREVADWYGLSEAQVIGARAYLASAA
jgi:uncharacterized protein (DUF433 family)/DNA-binding transcriptional MerR regulator